MDSATVVGARFEAAQSAWGGGESEKTDGDFIRCEASVDSRSTEAVLGAAVWCCPFWERFRSGSYESPRCSDSSFFALERLTQGTTNAVWKCSGKDGFKVVIRVFGKGTHFLIDRNLELTIGRFLGSHGIAPKIHGQFTNGAVSTYVVGRTLNTSELTTYAVQIAKHLARLHSLSATQVLGPVKTHFWDILDSWVSLIPKNLPPVPGINLQHLEAEVNFVKTQLGAPGRYPVALCHNDCQALNIVLDENSGNITFIDLEYSWYNYTYFDIANHFCEYGGLVRSGGYPSIHSQKTFLTSYLQALRQVDEIPPEEVQQACSDVYKFTLLSHLLWGVWGVVQNGVNDDTTFAYLPYTLKRWREYDAAKLVAFGACDTPLTAAASPECSLSPDSTSASSSL